MATENTPTRELYDAAEAAYDLIGWLGEQYYYNPRNADRIRDVTEDLAIAIERVRKELANVG